MTIQENSVSYPATVPAVSSYIVVMQAVHNDKKKALQNCESFGHGSRIGS